MAAFSFKTDVESEAYCMEIAETMRELFAISQHEAIERINTLWNGLQIVGKEDPIYHEDQDYWAKTIYYGKETCWWLPEEERMQLGLGSLTPVPIKDSK